ncbi:hypothetical protein B7P33_11025 [Sediminicola luteus]|uniref:Uncharacterized protein n=1 Tax=Sediminicola luteus TaxID=319238 RepID=A0A2A4G729_9FLAO|nr:hypothetical protein B7P33_11025 [Sediminicola luteus]
MLTVCFKHGLPKLDSIQKTLVSFLEQGFKPNKILKKWPPFYNGGQKLFAYFLSIVNPFLIRRCKYSYNKLNGNGFLTQNHYILTLFQ